MTNVDLYRSMSNTALSQLSPFTSVSMLKVRSSLPAMQNHLLVLEAM